VPTIAQPEPVRVTVGVDTHKDAHVAVAKDHLGRYLGENTIPTTPRGGPIDVRNSPPWPGTPLEATIWWLPGPSGVGRKSRRGRSVGDRGHRLLRGGAVSVPSRCRPAVIEINRPDRKARRLKGKSDPVDAEAAARAVLSGEATALPKSGDDRVEMIRSLRSARSSAVKARTQAINALRALVVSAPSELREQLRGLSATQLVRTCARMRPGDIKTPLAATKLALRSLAGRYEVLEAEIKILDPELVRLTAEAAPALVEIVGSAPKWPARCLSPPATTPSGFGPRLHSPTCAASRPSMRHPGRPFATDSIAVATARPTLLFTES